MTETATAAPLAAMKLPELKSLAQGLGIKGASAMRKGDLVSAIQTRREGGSARPDADPGASREPGAGDRTRRRRAFTGTEPAAAAQETPASAPSGATVQSEGARPDNAGSDDRGRADDTGGRGRDDVREEVGARLAELSTQTGRRRRQRGRDTGEQPEAGSPAEPPRNIPDVLSNSETDAAVRESRSRYDDEGPGGGRRNNRRRRQRDRQNRRTRPSERPEVEPTVSPDDVLLEVSGILDVLDN
ncbi:MAG: Rho termination factor N-terminal domain-containing protein, partial [Propionibacterium sp.]|nr:Rho termination factor N-terminal domain-containing protein [Propionibacterium sp.]